MSGTELDPETWKDKLPVLEGTQTKVNATSSTFTVALGGILCPPSQMKSLGVRKVGGCAQSNTTRMGLKETDQRMKP